MHAAGAFGSPAWISWMTDIVPDRIRGRYFVRRRQWGLVSAIPAAIVVGWLLDRSSSRDSVGPLYLTPSVRACAIIFLCAAVFGAADIHLFQYLPERPHAPRSGAELLASLAEPLRDRRFLRFSAVIGSMTFAFNFLGQFITLYVIERVHVRNTANQMMLMVGPMIAQLLVLPLWGRAADRVGRKPLLIIAGLGLVPVGLGWSFVHEGNAWLGYALSAIGVALWTGVDIANFDEVIERSDVHAASASGRRGGSGYISVNSVIVNLSGCFGGLAAGAVAQRLGDWQFQIPGLKTLTFYDALFALSAVVRLAAVVACLAFVTEPGAKSVFDALRFLAGDIRRSLARSMVAPLRRLPLARPDRLRPLPRAADTPKRKAA